MDNPITWTELGVVVLFALGIIVCIYLILLIRNLNSSAKLLKVLLRDNKDNLDRTLKDLPVVSKNLADISDTAKNELKSMESVINNISETVEMTAAAANTLRNDIVGKAKGIFLLVDIVKRVFFKDKDNGAAKRDSGGKKDSDEPKTANEIV